MKLIFNYKNLTSLILICAVFFLDRYSKNIIISEINESNFYLNSFINLNLIWNSGVGFGLFSHTSVLIYNFISAIILVVIIGLVYVGLKSNFFDKIIFSLILGGAIGNFYDRLVFSAVPDFIDFHVGNFHWFTFNIADIFISFGIIIFLTNGFFKKDK